MDQLVSGPRLVGRIGLGERVSASFQIFALRMLLHFAVLPLGVFLRGGNVSRGFLLEPFL